ncbi:BTB and MATH domain-containing protein [Paramyrothecium foliicola]|nr:BTB and MATH domain-containing protein [Paramyrothecium foliicola]
MKPDLFENFGARLIDYRDNGVFSDVVVCCEEQVFNVHRLILCSHSSYFAKQLDGKWQESSERKIPIVDFQPGVVEAMLQFMYKFEYSNSYDISTMVFDAQVYQIADKYDIPALKAYAKDRFHTAIITGWNMDEFGLAISTAYNSTLPQDRGLRDPCVEISHRNIEQLLGRDTFREVLRNTADFAADLIPFLCGKDASKKPNKAQLYACPSCGENIQGNFKQGHNYYSPSAVLHIKEQNAGVLISKRSSSVCFEMFGLSPTYEASMSAQGRLKRHFPTNAVEVSLADFKGEAFRVTLAKTLTKMSQQALREAKQMANKSKQDRDEDQGTTNPMIVTELFTSMLRGCGKEVTVQGICKNTREDVVWKNSKAPWRRSSFWLLVRVALQLSLSRVSGDGGETYKEFMAFLMAQALRIAKHQQKVASEVLHIMSTKVSRRICKLRSPSDGPWLSEIRKIISETSAILDQRWKLIREREEKPVDLEMLPWFKVEESTNFLLKNMDFFLDSIPRRRATMHDNKFRPTSPIDMLVQDQLPLFSTPSDAVSPLNLIEIESWVAANIHTWVHQHMKRADSPVRDLKRLIEAYHTRAASYYSDRPEGASRMILTIGELWYAADMAAVHEIPLLANYAPQIPIIVWQALLLRSKEEMQRLRQIEVYLHGRKKAAEELDSPSIFTSFGVPASFAVEYFRNSTRHQQIKYDIEANAARKRQEKRDEFRKAKAEYINLMQKYSSSECDVSTKVVNGSRHPSSCRRCGYESRAKALAVFVHEWPLPRNDLEAQATVFEMAVPAAFSDWRDLTVYFINDVLLSQPENLSTPRTMYSLKTYQPLRPWYTTKAQCRIHLRSADKPNAVIHRRAIPVEHSVESDVCLSSGLIYRYFDEKLEAFSTEFVATELLSTLCTFKLPEDCKSLDRFLRCSWVRPDGETPNEIIASQHECPDWMALNDFKALTSLRYGHRIQWMSILLQLAMPKVDFNRPETAIFLLQMCLQSGPESSGIHRAIHARLCDSQFGSEMLANLEKGIWRVRDNWESHIALWSFTFLAARVLALACTDLSRPFLDLLQKSREISHKWVRKLLQRAEASNDEVNRENFLGTALTIALVCIDSFDVYDDHLSQILQDSAQASILIECSIIINDRVSLRNGDGNILHSIMLDRWRHILYRTRPILAAQNALGQSFLSDATQRRWRAFKPESPWTVSTGTNCWYQTTVATLHVHLNILTGELLINGMPLSRLPPDYQSHDDYLKLFDDRSLHVMPSSTPGMAFRTTQLFHGHTVHFGTQGQDLLIRLENNASCLDLIPPRVFKGLLPDSFIHEYVHWYNNKTGFIEFCPLSHPYPVECVKWRLTRNAGCWQLRQKDDKFLLAPSSGLAQHLSAIMACLESPLNLYMVYDEKERYLEVNLPRLQLRFFMKNGEQILRSQQYKDMSVDKDQSIATLVGFRSKLVLRSCQDSSTRMLIIPEGEVHFKKQSGDTIHDHVTVCLQYGTARRVQAYRIDGLLGRLVANTKLESKLYLAYLHALTSFCRPDPFLGRRGTEEALRIFESASVRALSALSPTARKLMELTASLAPSRHYHPDNARLMQTVVWSPNLSFLTQDDRLFKVIHDIFERSSEIGSLYSKPQPRLSQDFHTTMDLVQRAISRDVSHFVTSLEMRETDSDDGVYIERESMGLDRAARATQAAIRAFHGHKSLTSPITGGFPQHLYTLMSASKLSSQRGAPSKRDLEYDSMWLQKPTAYLSSYWCQLHSAFQANQKWLHKMELVVWISTVAYSVEHDEQVTQALLLMAISPVVAAAPLPVSSSYDLSKGYVLQPAAIEAAAAPTMSNINHVPDGKSRARTAKGDGKQADRLKREYGKDKKQAINIFRDRLARQWPCEAPKQPSDYHMESYIDVPRAMKSILPAWRMWWANKKFAEYLEEFAKVLKEIPMATTATEAPLPASLNPMGHCTKRVAPFIDVFRNDAPVITTISTHKFESPLQKAEAEPEETGKVAMVIDILASRADFQFEHRYLDQLRQSLSNLHNYSSNNLVQDGVHATLFQEYLAHCISRYEQIYDSLLGAVQPDPNLKSSGPADSVAVILTSGGFHPTISPVFFLQQLRNSNWSKLSKPWKDAIIEYGLAITALQKAKRLIQYQGDPIDLLRELENDGHLEWSPYEHPEWLLVECESEIMIRPAQQQVARQMMHPPKGNNAVMQLNMGEGKSSVIVPIVSAALADGSKLVRVIVAKPQAKQMYQMLVSKLSGLLDRPVYQLPFSRDIDLDAEKAESVYRSLVQCKEEGGVLLVQPEHLLSLQLMELELELSEQSSLSKNVMSIRQFFDESSRDIVDESDENFSVKFELSNTLGQQRSIDHSPYRWIIVQEVLDLVRRCAGEVKAELPLSIDFDERRTERFPKIRILRQDAEKMISDRIADLVCETGMTGFPIARQPPKVRDAVRKYITKWKLSEEECQKVEHSRFWEGTTINHILLLRGLLAGGVLAFALARKRWRVNYGLDPTRERTTRLAVPYKAKDSPTSRSEFSHPDIVIVLTCLTYYYGGLGDQALFDSLDLLIRLDNADLEYQAWVNTAPTLPDSFKYLQGINLKDRTHCTSTIFPHLRYSKGAIDYYLCRMVFPKECKEFPYKLSASGWDLGKKKKHPTTGFSGTNDSRYVLPLGIKQLDLAEQNHTNALVLKHILQPENGIALMPDNMMGTTFDSQSLLSLLSTRDFKPRVILDVGAQIIDLTNIELARAWLGYYESDEYTQAVIFFNELDEIMVLDKTGMIEELHTSPFSDLLEQCLIFLDEAHTRGTDLRLPANYQAAVTLGAHVTKDRLAQACMRMRKLGKGQSVVFFVPREIEHEIRLFRGDDELTSPEISVSDVLCWAITETCKDLQRAVPLWLNQGLRFTQHQALWDHLSNNSGSATRLQCARQFMDHEGQSLDKRYRPRQAGHDISALNGVANPHAAAIFTERCYEFGLTELGDTSFNEEQERELAPELEQELQATKPPWVEPAEHQIHPGLVEFIVKGVYPKDPLWPAFMTLNTTSAAPYLDLSEFPSHMLVTRDFATTVNEAFGPNNYSDAFQRPVQWILTSQRQPSVLVIISPYEVQNLMPFIEQSLHVTLRLYSSRVNLGYESIDHLNLYKVSNVQGRQQVPRQVITWLVLFSGQLYLSSFADYIQLCDKLGLACEAANDQVMLGPDGFIPPGSTQGDIVNRSGFSKSPVRFLQTLMTKIRLDTEHIEKTHMAKFRLAEETDAPDIVWIRQWYFSEATANPFYPLFARLDYLQSRFSTLPEVVPSKDLSEAAPSTGQLDVAQSPEVVPDDVSAIDSLWMVKKKAAYRNGNRSHHCSGDRGGRNGWNTPDSSNRSDRPDDNVESPTTSRSSSSTTEIALFGTPTSLPPRMLPLAYESESSTLASRPRDWESLGGNFRGQPEVFSMNPRQIEVSERKKTTFICGEGHIDKARRGLIWSVSKDQNLVMDHFIGCQWLHDKCNVAGSKDLASTPAAACDASLIDIVAYGESQAPYQLMVKRWNSTVFTPWRPHGGDFRGDPVLAHIEPGRTVFFGIGADGNMYYG